MTQRALRFGRSIEEAGLEVAEQGSQVILVHHVCIGEVVLGAAGLACQPLQREQEVAAEVVWESSGKGNPTERTTMRLAIATLLKKSRIYPRNLALAAALHK